ncbi:phospho-N-acetylmuramoyl-pentapeptide-transferase homolog isoform X1 [Corylus avellana]|uniref:phospho-N-acetylmuramoyl-pentapeptide- transferase homolog isoform X1 n=1 Tax=Corylus avellana TaxID=13451 RepID=UPI00286A99FC|nr:phospho-N-acetylmuramoyl-pentapeptide-transferase homolog isoform X1 [Corylus avellana]
MPSHSHSLKLSHLSRLGLSRLPKPVSLFAPARFRSVPPFSLYLKLSAPIVRRHECRLRRRRVRLKAFDEDSVGIPFLDDWSDGDGAAGYVLSSSEDEESDSEIVIYPITDDSPRVRISTDEAFAMTTQRFAMLGRKRRKHRNKFGVLISVGLIVFLTVLLLFVDWCAWRIVRLPFGQFYLTRPFLISAILVSCAGYVCVPLLYRFRIRQIIRKEGPAGHSLKKRTPTMGGLFFVPIGVTVARFIAGFSSTEVSGAAAATLGFAAIGLVDDILTIIKNHNSGLSAWVKLLLEVAVGTWFSFWLVTTNISSPYSMKMLLPLPAPVGLVCLGKFYLLLTSFCFVSMGNGVNLTDGLDGLAGGTAALAFIAMSIAVLPICSDLAIFGASMAGACVGFLLHNRYRASVFMGDTGSLALGGALAAMAACTGMFFPLFISSGIFVMEASSVIIQVLYFKTTKNLWGAGRRVFRMAPLHHHLELCGIKEPVIVAGAYVISSILALYAGYVGLISA